MPDTRVILITGASRGIGRQLALDAARAGYAVVANFLSNETLAHSLVEEIKQSGGQALAVQADVSRDEDATGLIASTLEHFGRLDCVINNAGQGEVTPLEHLDAAHFERLLRINLISAFLVSQAAIPHMRERGGRLIFLSSGAARTGGVISAAYASSKAGIEGLMHYYATYLRPQRITANAIAPSLIESDMTRVMNLPPASEMPMGRLGRADEMWPAVRMILDTEYLTGQTMHIDAGRYMT